MTKGEQVAERTGQTITAYIPRPLREEVAALAERRGTSISNIVFLALRYYMKQSRQARIAELEEELSQLQAPEKE